MSGLGAARIPNLRSKPAMLAVGMHENGIPPALANADFQALIPCAARSPGWNRPVTSVRKMLHLN